MKTVYLKKGIFNGITKITKWKVDRDFFILEDVDGEINYVNKTFVVRIKED